MAQRTVRIASLAAPIRVIATGNRVRLAIGTVTEVQLTRAEAWRLAEAIERVPTRDA